MKRNRATDAEFNARVTEIQKCLLNGYTRGYILEMAQRKWKIAERTTDDYIRKAKDAIREINLVEREDNLASITTNLWDMFRVSRDTGNLQEAHKILMSIAKLRGLDEHVIQHFVNERPLQGVSDEELNAVLGGGDGRH